MSSSGIAYVRAFVDAALSGKKTFDGTGKLWFSDGFTPNYDTVVWIASKPRINPTLNSQGLYIQHRVGGDLGGFVNDAGASELRIASGTNSGAGQSAHENSVVVTGTGNDLNATYSVLANHLFPDGTTGHINSCAMMAASQVAPLPVGLTVDTIYGLKLDNQIAGATNYSLYAPDGDSVLGPIVPKDAATAALRAQGVTGQTGALLQLLSPKPASTTLFRVNANGTGGIGGQISSTFWVNNNLSTAATVALIIKAAVSQTADLQQWQDSSGTVLAKVGPSGAIKTLAVATGSRPSAATAGAGAQIFDTSLAIPLYSDGTAWRKYSDNTVA